MATTNLSQYNINNVPSAESMKFGIVVSEWNNDVTELLKEGAWKTLIKHGAKQDNIIFKYVPGSFELTLGGQFLAEYTDVDTIICIGCVIKGETPHFDFVASEAAKGIAQASLETGVPIIFGVITTDSVEQAVDRAGTVAGNRGFDAAMAAIEMSNLMNKIGG